MRLDGCYTLHGPARITKVGPSLILAELSPGAWLEVEGATQDGAGTLVMPEVRRVACSQAGSPCVQRGGHSMRQRAFAWWRGAVAPVAGGAAQRGLLVLFLPTVLVLHLVVGLCLLPVLSRLPGLRRCARRAARHTPNQPPSALLPR